jgi:hypothetical protein
MELAGLNCCESKTTTTAHQHRSEVVARSPSFPGQRAAVRSTERDTFLREEA